MIVKKSGKKVIGAHLSVAERKAMEIEINNQIAEASLEHQRRLEATVLYVLHEEFGFGKDRLRRFYESFDQNMTTLRCFYELPDSDAAFICDLKLKDMGIDLDEWRKELKEE